MGEIAALASLKRLAISITPYQQKISSTALREAVAGNNDKMSISAGRMKMKVAWRGESRRADCSRAKRENHRAIISRWRFTHRHSRLMRRQ